MTLDEAYEFKSGLSKSRDQFGFGFDFVTFKNVFYNYFLPDKLGDLVNTNEREQLACSVKRGDVFLTRTSETFDELGMSSVALKDYEHATFNGFCKRLRPKEGVGILPEYIGYYFRSPYFRKLVTSMATMTTRASLNNEILAKLRVKFPPLPEQKAIARILGKLDDKIELNRRMNQSLENMAQALFKSWFVDFDPVIDNALLAGRDIPEVLQSKVAKRLKIKESQGLQADERFPNCFVYDEELGRYIPEGWSSINLGELIKVKHGYAFKGEFFSSTPTTDILLTPGNFRIGGGIKLEKLKYYDGDIPEGYVLKQNDLIITMTDLSKEGDTLGFPALIPSSNILKYLHNQRLGKVEFINDAVGRLFVYHCLCNREYRQFILGSASGTTVKHTSPSKILLYNIAYSNSMIEGLFEKFVKSKYGKIEKNNHQTQTLTKLRDTLLPQLISGKLKVPEAMLRAEEAIG